MTEPAASSSGRRIRGFLAGRKQQHKKHQPQLADSDEEPHAALDVPSASATSSHSTSTSPETPAVAMEGPLKKRAAKMPVMHDRYCVATWELDADDCKCVMLRSYKSRRAYDAHPEKPSSVHQLKCISDWDGKTGFHRYQHAFVMETREKKLFQCVAPSAADKDKWVELLAIQSAFHGGRDMRLGSVGSLVPLRRTQSIESAGGKPRAYTSASIGKPRAESDANALADAGHSTDSEGQGALFRTTSGASTNSLELPNGDKSEPADWGLYGEASGEAKSKYELQDDAKPVLLDKELLDTRGETKTLATDSYLFEEGGASRFGAVVVKGAASSDEDDDAEFVDEEFAAREAQKENDKNMKRRAQKLESNRDLYAEMAAARLADMRKHARHPKKSHSRPSVGGSDESDEVELQDDDQSMVAEGEIEVEDVAELEDINQRRSSRSRRSSKSHKKSFVSSSDNTSSVNGGYVSGDDEEEEEVAVASGMTEAESAEAEELRQLKKKHRAERRAKKRLIKEEEEEERVALEAAELARAHREEQRAREEAKVREEQEKRDKKERREMKDRLKREKAKQRQAEAELRKLVELKQAEEERRERERKEKKDKKKSKKKEKYTPPAERIQKKEERDAKRAAESAAVVAEAETQAEVSNALVVVEKPAESEPARQPLVAPAPTPMTPAPTSTSSFVQTEAVPTEQAALSPPAVPAPVIAPVAAPAPVSGGSAAPMQGMPMYQVAPPPFVPSYPPGPHSMPAYGLTATFGAYPPLYPAPYSYGGPVGLQPTFMRPNMGFMAGLSALGSFGKAAGPELAPSRQDVAEPIIGPQLPTPEERAAAFSGGASAPSSPPPHRSADKSSTKLTNLPELPDVVEF